LEKRAQRAVVPLAAAGLPVACFAVSCQLDPRDLSGTKSTSPPMAKLAALEPVGSCRTEPSEINQAKTIKP
jgi:hypothetical protein